MRILRRPFPGISVFCGACKSQLPIISLVQNRAIVWYLAWQLADLLRYAVPSSASPSVGEQADDADDKEDKSGRFWGGR